MGKKKTEKGAKHSVHVFVYGSLKQGLGNHGYLTALGGEFVGYDTISGPFSMVSLGGFPATCVNGKVLCDPVYGQVFKISQKALDALDALEGHPRWYRREKLRTDIQDVRAWIYLFPESEFAKFDKDRHVEGNMWRPSDEEKEFWEAKDVRFVA